MTLVLVTGAAGFIGSHLVESLLADGVPVRGVDAFTDYYNPDRKRENLARALAHPHFEFVPGDLLDLDGSELLEGVSSVFHLAGQPGVRVSWGREFEIYTRQNVLATQRLLEHARDTQLERFVMASSSSVYGSPARYPTDETVAADPMSPYGVTKLAAEHLCNLYHRSFAVPTVTLRYFSVYGPRQRPDMALERFIAAALAGEAIEVYGDGHQARDFTYVADAVAATRAAASKGRPGAVYNIAGGSAVTVLELVALLDELLGRHLTVRHRPAPTGEPRTTSAAVARAGRELGYRPRMSLADGVAAQLAAATAERTAHEQALHRRQPQT